MTYTPPYLLYYWVDAEHSRVQDIEEYHDISLLKRQIRKMIDVEILSVVCPDAAEANLELAIPHGKRVVRPVAVVKGRAVELDTWLNARRV